MSAWEHLLERFSCGTAPSKKQCIQPDGPSTVTNIELHQMRQRATIFERVLTDVKQAGFSRAIDVTSVVATLGHLAKTKPVLDKNFGYDTDSLDDGEVCDCHMIAHRGGSLIAPENTESSMRAGIREGLRGVEFDLQVTSDGHIILLHDDTLERTALPYEEAKEHLPNTIDKAEYERILRTHVNNLPLKTVQAVDLRAPIPNWPYPEKATTFARVVSLIQEVPGAFGFAEIKSGGFLSAELVARAMGDLQSNPREFKFISFDLASLLRLQQLLPRFQYYHVLWLNSEADAMQQAKAALDAGMDGVDLCAIPNVVTEDLVKYVHSRGKKVATWVSGTVAHLNVDTVNNLELMRKRQVDYFTSDAPSEIRDWVKTHPHALEVNKKVSDPTPQKIQ